MEDSAESTPVFRSSNLSIFESSWQVYGRVGGALLGKGLTHRKQMVTKLRVRSSQSKTEQVVDITEAKTWDYYDPGALVVVENQLVRSYDELLEVASRDGLKDKDVLDVHLMVTLTGG